jgi:hypothetical protein
MVARSSNFAHYLDLAVLICDDIYGEALGLGQSVDVAVYVERLINRHHGRRALANSARSLSSSA